MPLIRFACTSCGRTLQVSSEHRGKQVRCSGCGAALRVPPGPEVDMEMPMARVAEPSYYSAIYGLLIAFGGGLVLYIYLIKFDDLSETQLVGLTPAWVFPLVFGIYGFVAQRLIGIMREGRAGTISEAVRVWTAATGILGLGLLLPFLFLKRWQSSLLAALVASAFWGVLLVIFFNAIFPLL